MPFKTATASTVQTGADISTNQLAPLSTEGLNSTNLGNFELAPVSTQEQAKRQHDVAISTQQTNVSTAKVLNSIPHSKGPSHYGLVKPTLEDIPKPPTGSTSNPSIEMTEMDTLICQLVIDKIWNCIWYLGIAQFFMQPTKCERLGKVNPMTPQQRLQDKVNRATRHDYQICMELYKIPDIDTATDLCVLALFDVIMLIDDSGSMRTTGVSDMSDRPGNTEDYDASEGANNSVSRWDLAILLAKVGAQVMSMFDDNGLDLRFLNSTYKGENITDHAKVSEIFSKMNRPSGGTPIGGAIGKIYNELLRDGLSSGTLEKPVLILTYTDGVSSDNVIAAVRVVRSHTRQTLYGSKCVLFSFCQVGNDISATQMLKTLDEDPDTSAKYDGAGDITDCTSSYQIEKSEYDAAERKKNGAEARPYTEFFHTLKGWIGPIMEKYDKADEVVPTNVFGGMFKSL